MKALVAAHQERAGDALETALAAATSVTDAADRIFSTDGPLDFDEPYVVYKVTVNDDPDFGDADGDAGGYIITCDIYGATQYQSQQIADEVITSFTEPGHLSTGLDAASQLPAASGARTYTARLLSYISLTDRKAPHPSQHGVSLEIVITAQSTS